MYRSPSVIAIRTLVWAAVALVGFAAGPAKAGDQAHAAVVGFSSDGRYVAFEEYGSQDGSGFPYSTIYVLDVAANDWVSGTPIKVLIDDTQMTEDEMYRIGVATARQQAMQQAGPVFSSLGIAPGNTGTTLVHHPYSDLDADPYDVTFSIARAFTPYLTDHNTLRLSLQPTRSATCESYGLDKVFIFSLDLQQGAEGGPTMTLQRDQSLPGSRGCPTDYRIERIVVFSPEQIDETMCCSDSYSMLVLLAVQESPGFEGPDYRYLGVSAVVPLQG